MSVGGALVLLGCKIERHNRPRCTGIYRCMKRGVATWQAERWHIWHLVNVVDIDFKVGGPLRSG